MGRKHNKEDNRFKFQSFSERVSNINIDIFHRVPHRYEVESEKEETYLYQAVEKWNLLNLTEKWILFQKELGKGITTLPELLNNKERIVELFLKHLRKQTEFSLQPVLEVLVAFIKDLRHEFYPFYPQILKELIALLKSDQADVVEWTFTSLSYIFKYLGTKLAKDLDKVILELAPLLDEKNRDHVRDFAAQSFAFVARKIKDRKKFLMLVLHTAQTHPELATGCAQLVFETMRGIKNRVHSTAEETLKLLLESFGDEQIPQKLLFFMTGHIIELYGKNIDVQYSILLDVFTVVLKEKVKDSQIPRGMTKLLKLLCMAIEIKLGAYVTNPKAVVDLLVTVFNLSRASSKIEMVLAMISVDMLRFENLILSQDATSLLILKALQMEDVEAKLFFIEQMSQHSAFETLILPRALQIFSTLNNLNFLLSLTKIVIQKAEAEAGDDFSNYKLLLNSSSLPLRDSLLQVFSEPIEKILDKPDICICSLILIRHVEPMDAHSAVRVISSFIENVLSGFDNHEDNKDVSLFILCTAIETLLHFKGEYENSKKKLDTQLLLSKLLCSLKDNESLVSLRILDSFLMLTKEADREADEFAEIWDIMEMWLTSPHKNGRLLALRVLKNLQQQPKEESRGKMNDVIEFCLEAEKVPLTLAEYREKLRLLNKLKCENLDLDIENQYRIPLKYLVGVLYSNFQLVWEPICEIIASYASKMRADNFWSVFYTELCKPIPDNKASRPPLNFDKLLLKSVKYISKENRVDHYNHRFLLLKTMKLFPELCERKNRDIVNFYLEFVQDEVLNSITGANQILNVKQKDLINLNDEEDKEVNDEDLELGDDETLNQEESESKEKGNKKKKTPTPSSESKSQTPKIAKTKWLVILLRLFSKFKNPKQCYRESELRSTFFELLLSGSSTIQKSALECILNYKFQYIEPYQANLRALTDDVKFKHEIIRFKIDKETGIVSDAHREELMPIVMRILFKKMTARTSVKRGNKGGAVALKRSIIFRFLAGCHNSEMEMFLKLAFEPFMDNLKEDAGCVGLLKTMESVDLEKVISPKRLRSGLNLIEVVFNHFGALMSDHLQRFMLKILLSIGANVAGVFLKRDDMFKGYLQFYKNLKNNCLDSITRFFQQYPNFPWTEDEIESVFEIFVWPNLMKLPLEGIHSPTALMRLFIKWSQYPRFFKLFAKYKKDDKDTTPLPFLMQLLLNEKIQSSVIGNMDNLLENLLTLREDDEDEEDNEEQDVEMKAEKIPLNVNHVLDVNDEQIANLNLKGELNYGSKILFPHVGSILTHLLRQLNKSPKRGLNKTEVSVLSRVTEMATSTKHGDALMKILLKLLSVRRRLSEEYLINMVTTVQNLMNIVANPAYYMKNLAVLFGSVEIAEARRILLNALESMEVRRPELADSVTIIKNLNAYDKKMVDQPDFEKRLEAFKSIRTLLQENKMDANLGIVILHNCFYFIRCETDLSLRDNASFCLQEICPKVAHCIKENKTSLKFWIESILTLIKNGMMNEVDNVQSFSISLLGIMARECSEMHPVLRDLFPFTNKADLEVDVFENAQHLQMYRRMKALLKFCSIAKTLKAVPTRRSLIEFILPLAARYLCKEEFIKRNSLIDAAIECIGTVCRLLPWQQYQSLLRLYLTKLRTKIAFQKQLLRVVVAILDAFHFDISQAEGEKIPLENPPEEQTTEKVEEFNEEEALEEMIEADLEKDEKEEEEEVPTEDSILAMEQIVILTPEAAARVEDTISNVLLDQLYKIIGQKTKADYMHKVNLKSLGDEAEEEEVLRIPLAVTVVKLLQKLPNRMLQTQLPGVFMRLCTYLKSRMESIRLVTRETLEKIVDALGPDCLPQLLYEMKTLLTKGFHLHVLVFTVHAIIQSIQSRLRPGDIDKNLETLLEACKTDLFGTVSEEKEVVQIQVKYVEARSTKSYQLFHLMAQYITESCLTDLLMPIKEVLTTSHSHKLIVKCRECFRHIVLGLSTNDFISCDNLFIFLYGVTSESIPELLPVVREESKKSKSKEKPDCYLIPAAPKNRSGALSNPVKNNAKSNSHVIIEFGFQLLISLLKKEKLQNLSNDSRAYLDPIVPVLSKSLESQHVKVTTLALQGLSKIFKHDLPSLKNEVASMRKSLFAILHKYGAAGLSKGDNFDLVLFTFKALSNMIRDLDYHGITVDQLKILLFYAEQDIHDTSKQATAFNLLKVILKRKLNVPELHELMMKVAALSVTSELDYIRTQARQAVYQYVMDYPFGKDTEEIIGFFLAQLEFDNEAGRQSTLNMISSFIAHFPLSVLNQQSSVFLISLGARLLNDDSPACKKLVSGVIKSMITRLEQRDRDKLFEIVTVWLREKKLSHKQLGAQVGGIFVGVEKEGFSKRFKNLLPLIQSQFTGESKPGQFVRVRAEDDSDRSKDNHLFQVLQFLLKICSGCPNFLTDIQYQEHLNMLIETAHSLLCHPHEWIRLAATQFLGYVFSTIPPDIVATVICGKKPKEKLAFLQESTIHQRIKSLILDHCAQLIPGIEIGEQFVEQVSKNLVYFAQVLRKVKLYEPKNPEETVKETEDEEFVPKLNLLWLVKRLRRIVNMEIAQTPGSYSLRSAIYKWIGATVSCLTRTELTDCRPLLNCLMSPIVRERQFIEVHPEKEIPIKDIIKEVSSLLRKKVTLEVYSEEAVKIQAKLTERRAQRKVQRAQEFVTDPQRAAKRKIEKQLRRKEAKKRKIDKFRQNKRKGFKRKRTAQDDGDDIF